MSSGDLSSNPQGQQTIPNVISATQPIDLDLIAVSQEVDLDEMESQIAAILQKTNFITVSQAVNLDTIESDTQTALSYATASKAKTDFIAVTSPINLDNLVDTADIAKLDFLTVTQNVDLDWLETEVLGHTSVLGVPSGSTHLGLFDSDLLPDNQDVKDCLAALASAIETTQAGTVTLTYTASPTGGSLTAGGNSVTVNAANSTNAGLLLPADFAKLALISVSSSLNLSALATDVAASKLKTDLITVATPINLGTLSSDLASAKGKTDLLTVTTSTNLDTVKSDIEDLQTDVAALQSSNGMTDLAYTASPTNGVITSSTGDDATLPLATTVNAGLLSPDDKTKLDSVASGATANASDAALRDRTTHTGLQTASTISDFGVTAAAAAPVQSVAGKIGAVTLTKTDVGLSNVDNTSDANKPISSATQTALNAKQNALGFTPENAANKGIPSGYASLGLDGKIPSAQLPEGGAYQGTWNANTNSPTITSSVGTNGDFYLVATAGTTTINGISSWSVGDQIRFNGTAWEKIPNSQAVSSVAGKTGAVTLDKNDVGLGNVLNVAQVASSRLVSAGTGLTGGGDLSADRTFAVSYGTTAGTACEGNDARLSDARTPLAHTHTAANVTDFNSAASAAAPVQTVAGRTGAVTLAVADVSGAAPLASPTFTGTPAAPTPSSGDNTTKIATTAFVKAQGYVTSSGVTSIGVTAPIASTGGTTPTLSISAATTGAAGSMSAADKTKLDRVTIAAPQNIDTIASNASDAKGKTDFISITQAVNLDTMESDLAGVKTKVDHISVSQAVNLDTLESDVAANNAKTQHITVTQAVNLDTMESDLATASGKTGFITVSTPVNLNNHQTTFGHLTVTAATDLDAIRTKANHLTVTAATDLDAIRTKANHTTVTAAVNLDRLRIRVLDVTDYGADPTGVADSTAAIQAAMTAAQPVAPSIAIGDGSSINRREPAALLFPKGIYRITSSLTDNTSGMGIIWLGHGAILKSDGISADRWMVELGQQGHETNAPMHIYIKGITFHKLDRGLRIGGVDNNINLGRIYFEDCNFIGNINDNGHAVRVYNRSASIEFKNCQWDNTAIALEVQSCDLVYLNECRMQIRHFPKLSEPRRQKFHGFFVVRHGQMHVRNFIANTPNPGAWAAGGTYAVGDVRKVNSTDDSPDKGTRWYYCKTAHTAAGGQVFNETYITANWELCEDPSNPMGWFKAEEFPDWAPSTHYVIGDIVYNGGTAYWCNEAHDSDTVWATHSAKFTAVNTNSLSVWTDITIDDSLFGGEGGGIPPVLWNIAPNTAAAAIQYQKALVIRNCQIGNDLQGYGVETYAVACLFAHRPNNFVFKNNRFAFTYCLPADYWVDATMPVWPPTSSVSASQYTPCDVDISGNNGSGFRGVTELADAKWSYSPNWIPYDMRVPTLYQNDAGPQLPGDHRAFKTNNTSSTSISRFLGAEPGKVFTVYITDANTTILNGNYIKLAGGATFTPGAAGGCITFLVIDDPTYQSRCMEIGRVTFA